MTILATKARLRPVPHYEQYTDGQPRPPTHARRLCTAPTGVRVPEERP